DQTAFCRRRLGSWRCFAPGARWFVITIVPCYTAHQGIIFPRVLETVRGLDALRDNRSFLARNGRTSCRTGFLPNVAHPPLARAINRMNESTQIAPISP